MLVRPTRRGAAVKAFAKVSCETSSTSIFSRTAPPARGATAPNVRRSPTDPHEAIDPVIDDELYCVDEIPPEDA